MLACMQGIYWSAFGIGYAISLSAFYSCLTCRLCTEASFGLEVGLLRALGATRRSLLETITVPQEGSFTRWSSASLYS
jgi:hypothetical protein